MEIDSYSEEAGSIFLRPEEGGGFFLRYGPRECIGNIAVISCLPQTAVVMIERGDMDLFKNFVRPDAKEPGVYLLQNEALVTIRQVGEDWEQQSEVGFREFKRPFVSFPQR